MNVCACLPQALSPIPGGCLFPPGMATQPAERITGKGWGLDAQLQAWQVAAYTLVLPTVALLLMLPWQVAAYTLLLPRAAPLLMLLVGHWRGFMLLSLWMCKCSSCQRSQLFRNSIRTFRGKRRETKAIYEPSAHKMAPLLH